MRGHVPPVSRNLVRRGLKKMGAPPKSDDVVATADMLTQYDGILFGLSARFVTGEIGFKPSPFYAPRRWRCQRGARSLAKLRPTDQQKAIPR